MRRPKPKRRRRPGRKLWRRPKPKQTRRPGRKLWRRREPSSRRRRLRPRRRLLLRRRLLHSPTKRALPHLRHRPRRRRMRRRFIRPRSPSANCLTSTFTSMGMRLRSNQPVLAGACANTASSVMAIQSLQVPQSSNNRAMASSRRPEPSLSSIDPMPNSGGLTASRLRSVVMGQAASRAALTSTMKKRCDKRTALAFGMGAQAARCMDSCGA
jgi:hypothetical protein